MRGSDHEQSIQIIGGGSRKTESKNALFTIHTQLFRSSLHVSDAQNLALQVLLKKMSKAEVNVLPYKAGYPSEPDRKDESVQANVVRAGKNTIPKIEGSHDSPDGSQQPNFTAFKDLSPSSDSSSTKAFKAGT